MARAIIVVHRWLGVALCAFFLLWFPSGIGMMYFPYPDVSPEDRLARAPALTPSAIALSPAEAAMKLGVPADELQINMFDGRPAYRMADGRGSSVGPVLYADTGEEQGAVTTAMAERLASAWTGQPTSDATVERVQEVDQWTLQMSLAALDPVWKYSWPNGEQVYVSQASGEVVQYTTTASRIGAYLGPIPHWLYFTPLRKHGLEWTRLVVWSSAIGTLAALLGVAIGAWRYSPARRYRYRGEPSSLPYRGQKRWHLILGLVFGVATATYAFSGMLSMDPFPSLSNRSGGFQRGGEVSISSALRGTVAPQAYDAKHPRQALEQLADLPVKQLELTSFAGTPAYLARLANGETRVVPVHGEPAIGFDRDHVIRLVTAATNGRASTRVLDQYDRYYLDRDRKLPLPVVLAQLTTGERTRYYIDPRTARIVRTYSSRNWVNRWLYNGLHSLNFPWLYNYRPLWDIVVITLMLGGTALGVTSLVLAWRVLERRLNYTLSRPAISG